VVVLQLIDLRESTRFEAPHGRTRSDAVKSPISTFIRMATRVGGPLSNQTRNGFVCTIVLIRIQREMGMGYEIDG
jgi:hypothetical protein